MSGCQLLHGTTRLSRSPRRLAAFTRIRQTQVRKDERPSKDEPGVEYSLDSDCDGKADYLMIVPDKKREPITYLFEDGYLDVRGSCHRQMAHIFANDSF